MVDLIGSQGEENVIKSEVLMKNNKRSMKFFENRRRLSLRSEYHSPFQTVFCPDCGRECFRKPGELFLTELKTEQRGLVTITKHEEHRCK